MGLPFLIYLFVLTVVILNSQSVLSVDFDRQRQAIVEEITTYSQRQHEQLKGRDIIKSENEEDEAGNKKHLVDADKKLRTTRDSINGKSRVGNVRRIEEKDKIGKVEEKDVPEDRSSNVIRPSYVLGPAPTLSPSIVSGESGGI